MEKSLEKWCPDVQISAIHTKKPQKDLLWNDKLKEIGADYCCASFRAIRWYCDGVRPVMRLNEVTNVERDLKPTLSLMASMV